MSSAQILLAFSFFIGQNSYWHLGIMYFCDLTLPTPEENLACDEALLESAERGVGEGLLRIWEPASYFVVIGYGNRAAVETNLEFCRQNHIPVLRRCTGGGAVLQGPGCLNYSLILRIDEGHFENISTTNSFILKRHQAAVAELIQAPVEHSGDTDLVIGGLKFSGNSQRRKKHFLIFHGTFLLHLDISLIEKTLPFPSKQPKYRLNRSHTDFLINIKIPAEKLKTILVKCWGAFDPLPVVPFNEIRILSQQKYRDADWNFRL